MKKLNSKGFTLIELLAVITIMGILMMVAIPSVSRTIENSRRDTFADNALTYIKDEKNNFSYFESFTKTSLTIDSIPYFCYTLNEPVQADSVELVFK